VARRPVKTDEVVCRDVAGERILVPIRQRAVDLQAVYSMNETSSFIWEQIDGRRTEDELRELLCAEFDVDAEEAGRDLRELLEALQETGAIEMVEA